MTKYFCILLLFISLNAAAQLTIHCNVDSEPLIFGIRQIEKAIQKKAASQKVIVSTKEQGADVIVKVESGNPGLIDGGYSIKHQGKSILVIANDEAGAMYATMEIAEHLTTGKKLQDFKDKLYNPRLSVRAVKFNLPWSPYRTGKVMEQHYEVCRDLGFWQSFLDEMALNRFNVLSLWNVHPFSYMVKPINFPKANSFTDQEMKSWKDFWTSLFRMAKDRGIETFIVNWNIAVSPEFASAYGVKERNDTSAVVKKYTWEVVTQVINEYPDLSGIGITLADWMSNFRSANSPLPEMNAKDREDWIDETVVAGVKAANREVKFLHRSVLSADPAEMRRVIDNAQFKDTTLVEVKFNWSHGHSTPLLAITHDAHSGKVDNGYWSPMPKNYRIQWMIRNEDFFILRWGQSEFIRKHITRNTQPYVNGYFVGSEGYIPAKDFSHVENKHKNWKYAFEKQWLFYKVWGRLLYDPATPDELFASAFDDRYGKGLGKTLMNAYNLAGRMPLRLASFHSATWDYTLYSEGFLAPFAPPAGLYDKVSSFISIDELIDHPTLDPRYLSIPAYVQNAIASKTPGDKTTPGQLADSLEADGDQILKATQTLRSKASGALLCELDDLDTWAYLSKYFATKIRAGIALHTFRTSNAKSEQEKSVKLLSDCLTYWKKISEITKGHYNEIFYLDDQSTANNPQNDGKTFSWSKYLPQVERDIEIARQAKAN
ncbi:MAG TPA: hypothetical protein VK589_18560 [Chryseolinea sp.]|nr:hypothetical protein [Chryseolinea sp.]